jgi:uncharacterized protein YndB with AHSA1/START domain
MTYEYVSHWHLDVPPPLVWRALTEVERWPAWWPYVRRVQTLRPGSEDDGLGSVRRIAWGSRLPYGFTLDVECTQAQRHRLLRGAARGDLEGEGTWELEPGRGHTTHVRYTWRLTLNTRWMRLVAPLMAPVFRWNHERVMAAGARGLARHLGARLLSQYPAASPVLRRGSLAP